MNSHLIPYFEGTEPRRRCLQIPVPYPKIQRSNAPENKSILAQTADQTSHFWIHLLA